MKHSFKRWTALLLALVMTASLLPVISLPSSAKQVPVGTLDHTDIISLPITIRNHAADGMLFEWDGIGTGEQEDGKYTFKPFRNPYNTNDITEPIPLIGANPAVGQLFCNDWDISNLNKNGIEYHYGETYDSRYAHIEPGSESQEYTVWNQTVQEGTYKYMVLRFRAHETAGTDLLSVRRYTTSPDYFETVIDLSTDSADNDAYQLVGTEDGWTTMVVDLNKGSDHKDADGNSYGTDPYAPPNHYWLGKYTIAFSDSDVESLDISFVAFFKYLKHNDYVQNHSDAETGPSFRYTAYDFLNQDYCFRMDDPTITMVEPMPAMGFNVLISRDATEIEVENCVFDKTHVTSKTTPAYDSDKYVSITANGAAVATVWTGTASNGRYAAIRCSDVDAELQIVINESPVKSFNPHSAAVGVSGVLELREEDGWKTVILDLGASYPCSSLALGIPQGLTVNLAYLGLFQNYDLALTTGYNYATDAHVFVFEDYSYRHDRVSYNTTIEKYQVYLEASPDNSQSGAIRFERENGTAFDPTVVYNNEANFYLKGDSRITPVKTFNEANGTKNGTVTQVDTDPSCYLELQDSGSEMGIGLRTVLLNDVNLNADQLQYVTVSYCVPNPETVAGDTAPMYVMLDTAGSGFNYSTVTLGFFDAIADGRWHVDVLDLSECVSRFPNGETYKYKHDTFSSDDTISRIGLADGWAVRGTKLQLAYMAFFSSKRDAEQYANAYSEANKSVKISTTKQTFSVITDAFTAQIGQIDEGHVTGQSHWEDSSGRKCFRVGSNNGFELLDPDYCILENNGSNYCSEYDGNPLPNYYHDMGFANWVQEDGDGHYPLQITDLYTNYNKDNNIYNFYNDAHTRSIDSTNGSSGIWAKSVNTYGYIMGLTERKLENGQLRYRQEVVEYLAQLLKKALYVPRTFMWDGIQFYSANYVQGDVDGEQFGYYDGLLEDGSKNINAMFPRDYAGWLRVQLGVTREDGSFIPGGNQNNDDIGRYEDTAAKGETLIADRNQIETWMDAAYYMLNTLFLPSAGEAVPEYKYLQLVRETPESGSKDGASESYYVFDTRYTNVMFDFDKGVIGNNSPNVSPNNSIKDTTEDGQVATYAFLPILREMPEFQATIPYLKDTGIADKEDGAESYYNRDYNFTLECHGTFTYYADKDLFFQFDGDDDVYLYVDGTCVLDLGGGHRAANQLIKINDYVSKGILNLEENGEYPFDFYFMERHGTGSNLRIQTNMEVFSNNIQTEKTASQTIEGVTTELPDYSMADFTKPVSYSFAITNNFDPFGKLTNFSFKDSDIKFYAGYDSVSLGDVSAVTARQPTDLTVTVKDSGGNVVFTGNPNNNDQLMMMLSDPGNRGGLAYGETLILSGVKYVIGESHSAFSNTVISRAGKHSGVAYHHLLSDTSSTHYFAWKNHELDIPISEIVACKDPSDTGSWSDIYRCNDSLNALNTGEVVMDRDNGVIKVTYGSTGTRRLTFTSNDTSLSTRYPISVDVHVLDAADNVYVLDFDGRTNLGKDVENNNQYSFAQNDVYSLPGVNTKVCYEAFTDEAPSYSENHLSFERDPWYKDYLTNPSAKVLVTIDSDKSYRDRAGGALEQRVTVGQPMAAVIVHPTNPFSNPLSAPSIDPSSDSGITATQIHNRLYLEASGWWLDDDATTKIRFCDSNDNVNPDDSTFVPMNEISSENGEKRYWIDLPANGNYTHFRIVRYGYKDNSWQYWNETGTIALDGNNVYRVNNGNVSQLSNINGASYMISGSPTRNTAVSFSGTATAPAVDPYPVSPPYYFKEHERVSLSSIDNDGLEMGTNSSQGTFTVKLSGNDNDLPTLYYRPKNIMDGASNIWLTSRVYENKTGVTATPYLGNADPKKEVEMFQRITVVPANVVYYEDANAGIVYNADNEYNTDGYQQYQPTVTWTHVLDNETESRDFVASPDQSADQSSPYGYDPAYTAAGKEYSGNGATKITFKGNITLAEFDFTGTGFDLFSRCMSDAPTVIAKVYRYSNDSQHVYTDQDLVQSAYVITEFNNSGVDGAEVMYQVPVLSLHNLEGWAKYHVVLDGIGHVDMSGWTITKRSDGYYMIKGSEEWKIVFDANGHIDHYEKDGISTTMNPASVDTVFWLDGLRVYGALNASDQNLYYNPGEANASFIEVRNLLNTGRGIAVNYTDDLTQISNGSFTSIVELRNKTAGKDLQLEDGNANLSAYFLVGPNNELYLKSSPTAQQAVAFTLSPDAAYSGTRTFQIAAKLLDTTSFGTPDDNPRELAYLTAANTWKPLGTIQSGTELYYELDPTICPQLNGAFVVIIGVRYSDGSQSSGNNSETQPVSLISLTKVKYKGWIIEKKYSDEMNFLYYNDDPSTGIIIGVSPKGNEQLGAVIRLLTAARPQKPAHPFCDVPSDAWYADPVAWAYGNGITAGVSADSFGPEIVCTRAQAVTFLWKAAGAPEPTQTVSFADVADDSWYATAVAWAYENGITAGTSASTFSPGAVCTRAQVATFLWRWAGSPESTWDCGFTDVASDAWYAPAVRWAAENGITAGTSANTFSPTKDCNRAEIVTFLYRSAESINGGEQE